MAKWWPVGEKQVAYVAEGSDADSHYTALILCEDDVALSIERAEFAAVTTEQAWEVIGADGSLHMPMGMRGGKPNAVLLDRFVPGEGVASETVWEKGEGGGGGGGLLEDFVLAVREGREPRTTLERALVMQKITNGIYDSAESGRAVEIE
jgi:predicted dehydrogenase